MQATSAEAHARREAAAPARPILPHAHESSGRLPAAFVDTNVLAYCTDGAVPANQRSARSLVERLSIAGEAVVSTQCWSSCSTRSLASRSCRWRPRRRWCWPAPPGPWSTDLALVTGAVSNSIAQQVSIWDAMVIEAALRAEAQALYSEDFAHGRHFGTLVVINPFLT